MAAPASQPQAVDEGGSADALPAESVPEVAAEPTISSPPAEGTPAEGELPGEDDPASAPGGEGTEVEELAEEVPENTVEVYVDGQTYESGDPRVPTDCAAGADFALDFGVDGATPILTLCGEGGVAQVNGIWTRSPLEIEVRGQAEVNEKPGGAAIEVEDHLWIYGAPGSDAPENNVVDVFGNMDIHGPLDVGKDGGAVTVWVMEGEGPPEDTAVVHNNSIYVDGRDDGGDGNGELFLDLDGQHYQESTEACTQAHCFSVEFGDEDDEYPILLTLWDAGAPSQTLKVQVR